jgi:polyisoprenoid-binding protein YceI
MAPPGTEATVRRALRRISSAAALLWSVAPSGAQAQPVTATAFARGDLTFRFHSTIIGAVLGRAPIARAVFEGSRLEEVRGMAEVRIVDMTTGISLRDRHMREAMNAGSYPTVRFDLVDSRPGASTGDSTRIVLEGRLTLDGVTRPVTASGVVVMRPAGLDVEATFQLDMRDFGIKPPVRALVLHVAPDVVVTARLSFASAPGP